MPLAFKFLQQLDEVPQRASQAIYGPCGDQVELATRDALEHLVEGWSLVPALRPADPLVREGPDDLPAMALGDGLQLAALVLNGLAVG
jgi:hypothetical protein